MRGFFIVLDGCGVGELPDAAPYGDSGSATLPHTAEAVGGLSLPHLNRLGLGKIAAIAGLDDNISSLAAFGKMAEASAGKDSTSGHWEHFGVVLTPPLPLYPEGFPEEIITVFENRSGHKIIGNEPASGTEIINRLGQRHLDTGDLIVYTSADSVFQIAAHEDIIPPEELYRYCRIAREIMTGPHAVGRIIARPFRSRPGAFIRTSRRKDFSLPPPTPFVTETMIEAGIEVTGIGKIYDLMAERGFSRHIRSSGNEDNMKNLFESIPSFREGLIMVNLGDFDTLWGHRNDSEGFARGLERFDTQLGQLLSLLTPTDLLIITADHGCDPTTPSTDHSREYVPLLVYYPQMPPNINLGTRKTFADTGRTIADIFKIKRTLPGRSFLKEILP